MNATLEMDSNGIITGLDAAGLDDTPYFLSLNRPNNSVSIGADASSDILSFSANADGPLRLTRLGGDFGGNALVQLKINDGKSKIDLTSGGIHSSAIFGSGLKPYPLPQALYMDELRRIEARITNLTHASITVIPCFIGSQARKNVLDQNGSMRDARKVENRLCYPFIYGLNGGSTTLTALGTAQGIVTIRPEFDFQLYQISGVSTGRYTLDIIDGNTGESLFNSRGDIHYEISDQLIVGTNFYPFRLEVPRTFRRGQKILINMTDTSSGTNEVYLAFAGRNVASELPRAY